VSEIPFGFGKPGDPDDGDDGAGGAGRNPFGFGGPGGEGMDFGGMDIGQALHRFADMMSWQGGPVNWDLAKDVARQAAAGDDPSVTDEQRRAAADAVRLAELWLDAVTSFPAATVSATAWSRAEWIERTLPAWKELVDPVAAKVVDAFGGALVAGQPGDPAGGLAGMLPPGVDPEQLPAQMQQLAGPMAAMMRQMGGLMFGGQIGQALGALSREVVSSADVGLPLAGVGHAALMPAGIATFGSGLGIADDDVRLFVALREAAVHRLFAGAGWLRARLISAIEEYARGIAVDTSRIQEALGSIDPTDAQALQDALAGGLFEPQTTPAQQAALARLETLLALIEGWVDDVVAQAAAHRLGSFDQLAETVRRRRAIGGPAEQTFATLVGLELRPRRLREAAQLWQLLRESRGNDGRDALWAHRDLLPTSDDLDDPAGFLAKSDRDADIDLTQLTQPRTETADGPSDGPSDEPDDGPSDGPTAS
jgi:putative hydrolase